MFHISDCKLYSRCPRLFRLQRDVEKTPYQSYVRLDETVTDLAEQKLGVFDAFHGQRGDDPSLAILALSEKNWLVKARFEYSGLRCKVPFLHRVDGGWDLYFLFIGLYPHADDMQFYCDTAWVLRGNGVKIKHAWIIHLNASYVRGQELDPQRLFVVSDCFYNPSNHPSTRVLDAIRENMRDMTVQLRDMEKALKSEPVPAIRKPRCASRSKCRFYEQCFPNEGEEEPNSILTLIGAQYRYQMKRDGVMYLKDAELDRLEGSRQQYAQIMADRAGGLFVDRAALRQWVAHVHYPIAFLDFEWERYAIPPYEGMRPYDVLPFEYSVDILHEDGRREHKVFLSIHDDRLEMVQGLLRDIPDSGSVMAYNAAGAEMIRIAEFAEVFPQYRERLLDINKRMIDLQLPFLNGLVYDTRMRGGWSLKQIMGVMDDPGYSTIDIHEGMEAVFRWRSLDREDPEADREKIEKELREYCGMDSYAMLVIFRWMKSLVEESEHL